MRLWPSVTNSVSLIACQCNDLAFAVLCAMPQLEATRMTQACVFAYRELHACVFQQMNNKVCSNVHMTKYRVTYKSSAMRLLDVVVTVVCVTSWILYLKFTIAVKCTVNTTVFLLLILS